MKTQRLIRINELLKREIADLLFREMVEPGFDPGAVTVTRAQISSNLRHARIGVSVRGDEAAVARVFNMLRERRGAIQRKLRRQVILKYTPVLDFVRDDSLAEGDRILDLLDQLPPPADEPGAGEP